MLKWSARLRSLSSREPSVYHYDQEKTVGGRFVPEEASEQR